MVKYSWDIEEGERKRFLDLKKLIASGIRGSEYVVVLNEYMKLKPKVNKSNFLALKRKKILSTKEPNITDEEIVELYKIEKALNMEK